MSILEKIKYEPELISGLVIFLRELEEKHIITAIQRREATKYVNRNLSENENYVIVSKFDPDTMIIYIQDQYVLWECDGEYTPAKFTKPNAELLLSQLGDRDLFIKPFEK